MKNKKFSFTKLLVTAVAVIFVVTLIVCLRATPTDYEQASLYAVALTATGSILLTTLIFYSKKSQAENLQKIKAGYYEQTLEYRLKYNKEMLKLRRKYGVDEEIITEIEDESDFDDVSNDAFYEGADRIEETISDLQSDIEPQEVD